MAEHATEQNLFKLYPNLFHIYLGIDMRQSNINGDFEVETLEKFWKNNGIRIMGHAHKIDILKQLIQCIRRLHQQSITCPQLSASKIYLSKSQFDLEGHIPDDERINDIHLLANIYCSVLTNRKWQEYKKELPMTDIQCSDPDIALDILRVMTDKDSTPNIEDVFRHPFYWSDFTKIYFICSAVEYINSEKEKKKKREKKRYLTKEENISILENYSMNERSDVIPDGNWMAALKLTMEEIRRGNEKNENVMIGDNVIFDIAQRVPSEGNSVFDLMRFFRNRYTHHLQDEDDIKIAFGGYPSGYLRFFTSRFPNLFMHVYQNMKDSLCREDNREEFYPTGSLCHD